MQIQTASSTQSSEQTQAGNLFDEGMPSPPGHDEKMIERFEQAQQGPQEEGQQAAQEETPSRPEWLPEKFWKDGKPDYEGLAKSYGELEKKFSQPKPEEPKAENASEDAAREATKAAGIDYDSLTAKYVEKGAIDDSDFEALEKAGIPRHYVEAYIEGQKAIQETRRATIFNEVGGQQNYEAMVRWAAQSLTPAEIQAYNEAIDSGDMARMKQATLGLYSSYTKVNGSAPNLVMANNSAVPGDVFRSAAELKAAIADPRYNVDPAYRADVQAKLGRSNLEL